MRVVLHPDLSAARVEVVQQHLPRGHVRSADDRWVGAVDAFEILPAVFCDRGGPGWPPSFRCNETASSKGARRNPLRMRLVEHQAVRASVSDPAKDLDLTLVQGF